MSYHPNAGAGGGGGGAVQQVVYTNKADTFTWGTVGFVSVTGLSAVITPSSTANKVKVTVSLGRVSSDQTDGGIMARVTRNGTPVGVGNAASNRSQSGAMCYSHSNPSTTEAGALVYSFVDEPASTSALTYQVEVSTSDNGGETGYVNRGNQDIDVANIPQWSRSASTLILEEIS